MFSVVLKAQQLRKESDENTGPASWKKESQPAALLLVLDWGDDGGAVAQPGEGLGQRVGVLGEVEGAGLGHAGVGASEGALGHEVGATELLLGHVSELVDSVWAGGLVLVELLNALKGLRLRRKLSKESAYPFREGKPGGKQRNGRPSPPQRRRSSCSQPGSAPRGQWAWRPQGQARQRGQR